jgi:hypothetical protein
VMQYRQEFEVWSRRREVLLLHLAIVASESAVKSQASLLRKEDVMHYLILFI